MIITAASAAPAVDYRLKQHALDRGRLPEIIDQVVFLPGKLIRERLVRSPHYLTIQVTMSQQHLILPMEDHDILFGCLGFVNEPAPEPYASKP